MKANTKTSKKARRPRHRNNRVRVSRAEHIKFFVISAVAVLTVGFVGMYGALQPQPTSVLAYATNMSREGLLASTNVERQANGLPALRLNSLLNNAAVAKANDMVSKDYWAHTAPDGTEPWDFILGAGYSYQTAGENLAYGALTSQQTVDAWMNSPGHRANILKTSYTEVGFGFVNGANYQNSGNQTVVVAMYASPYGSSSQPTQPAPAPAPTPAPAPEPQPQPTQPASSPAPVPQEESKPVASTKEPVKEEKPAEEQVDEPTKEEHSDGVVEPANTSAENNEETQTIRRIQVLSGIYSPWLLAGVMVAGTGAGGTFLYHHSRRWHNWILRGEKFVAHHVLLDFAVLSLAVVSIMMLQTVGKIL